jgi:DNA repair photolyase
MSNPGHIRTVSNPANPYRRVHTDWDEEAPAANYELTADSSQSILSENDSPDIPFRWSVNPYRGCFHACAYCYARPTHQYLDFGAGTDFDKRIVYKPEAPALLAAAFDKRSWSGELVVFSGVTDCYQPAEAELQLTRRCIEVCLRYQNPAAIITKSTLVARDCDLLAELAERSFAHVTVSIPFFDAALARLIEPMAPSPQRRLETIRRLAAAGVPVGVNMAPIIPGLNDSEIPRVLEAARDAGARSLGTIMVRLPREVGEVFEERLRAALPDRAERVLHQIEACRAGQRTDPRFGSRMVGQGQRWHAIEQMVGVWAKRLGLGSHPSPPAPTPFRRPSAQLSLNF